MSERLGLIFPRFRYPSGDFPLGIALLAAYVRREMGMEVVVCDTTFDPRLERIERFLDREKPDYVGVGMSTLMLGEGLSACEMAKARGLPVFVGGPHPTTYPDAMIAHPAIDAVAIGEGELATVELLDMFRKGRRHAVRGALVKDRDGEVWVSKERRPVEDLDSLPWPSWDLIDMEAYIAAWGQLDSFKPGLRGVNLVASRGCPFDCSFCQPVLDAMFGKKLRQRSPESVVRELAELRRRFDIEGAWFTDDTFTTNRRWVLGFCQALRDQRQDLYWGCTTRANLIEPDLMRTMYDHGLRKIGIGMESATERVREDIYQKGVSAEAIRHTVVTAREMGVQTLLFLMLGAPSESRQEMLKTIEMATHLPASEASFSLFVPIPGTDLHASMVDEGYEMSSDYTDYDYYARQPFVGDISRRELRMIQRLAYLRFYAHPYRWRSMARNASSVKGLRSMGRKLMRIVPHGAAPRVPGADLRTAEAARVVQGRPRG
ncbi:MAG: cobalamin B12-binding domain-containing protein [Alphaproteobacteria bacterium]|nr:cobalamin B12-binding domain-containing protein [Alphaproteobacteria bacterium]